MRVVILGGRRLYAEALGAALTIDGQAADVHACTTLDEAIAHVAHEPADVVLVDEALPDPHRVVATRLAPLLGEGARILLLAAGDWIEAGEQARSAGLDGAVSKFASLRDLPLVARARGGGRTPPPVRTTPDKATEKHRCSRDHRLTPREYQVMRELARGRDNATIAARLGITRNTARTHVHSVLTKLEVSTRLEAATHALRHDMAPAVSNPDETAD